MEVESKMNDATLIKQTLMEMGCDEKSIEIHEKPVQLKGYYVDGSDSRLAHIVIRQGRQASYDIGFHKNENGQYSILINDMERSQLARDIQKDRLRKLYDKNTIVQIAEQVGRGQEVEWEEDQGKVQIQIPW
jgi:hypothetical protein